MCRLRLCRRVRAAGRTVWPTRLLLSTSADRRRSGSGVDALTERVKSVLKSARRLGSSGTGFCASAKPSATTDGRTRSSLNTDDHRSSTPGAAWGECGEFRAEVTQLASGERRDEIRQALPFDARDGVASRDAPVWRCGPCRAVHARTEVPGTSSHGFLRGHPTKRGDGHEPAHLVCAAGRVSTPSS